MDFVVVVDGSRSILADEFEGVKKVLGGVLDQIVVSNQPSRADRQARVALYQQTSTYSDPQPAHEIFSLREFSDRNLMKSSIIQKLKQTGGSHELGSTLEFAFKKCFNVVPESRKNKMILAIIGEETALQEKKRLDSFSRLAKCSGIVLFTLTVGDSIASSQVEELASYPSEQHIIHLGHLKHGEQEYTQRFMRTFFHILSSKECFMLMLI